MSTLRDYQTKQKDEIYAEWSKGHPNVLAVCPTGGGKTVTMGRIFAEINRPSIAFAHRQELVGQISMALARERVHHRIIAPTTIIKTIVGKHTEELGTSFHHESAPTMVASVDTILRREIEGLDKIEAWQTDEGHHLLAINKWARAIAMVPNAKGGVGWTATPHRSDRRQLSRVSGDGLYDAMVPGPIMRQLMDMKFLCEYVVYGPPTSIDRASLPVSSETGDFTQPGISKAARGSTIVGDVVASYLRFAPGLPGLTFAVDVAMAEEHAAAFQAYGVPAVVVHQKTKNRDKIVQAHRRGEILQIVNCEVFTEGTDMPWLRVISGARPTESLSLFIQMFGRLLRTYPGKPYGIYIDHVDNVRKHGLPDGITGWTLAGEVRRRNGPRVCPTRTCTNCFRAFEGYSLTCPYCGARPARAEAIKPDVVEGDLTEYGPELMAQLRAAADEAVRTMNRPPRSAVEHVMKDHMFARAAAQGELREAMAWWAGVRGQVYGEDDSTMYRRFYHTFGIDAYSAKGLPGPKARELAKLVREDTRL